MADEKIVDDWEWDPPWIGPHRFTPGEKPDAHYCGWCGGHQRDHYEARPPDLGEHEEAHTWLIQERALTRTAPRGFRYLCACGSKGQWRSSMDDALDGHRGHVQRAADS